MSDILLAKPTLPEGWIDTSVGEASLIRENFFNHYSLGEENINKIPPLLLEYPPPNGFKSLTSLLEEKYQAPVVVTNGAKQALGASFYCLKKLGVQTLGMKTPYWALIPPLVNAHGLTPVTNSTDCESWLDISPNNPDGDINPNEMDRVRELYKNKILIHDAVYYTHSYLPSDFELRKFGDVQIYSASKMYGLSGLRLGWIVCHNTSLYRHLCEYVEMMTVGVSSASQRILENILKQEKEWSPATFEKENYLALRKARQLFKTINPDIVELPENFEDVAGMFAWLKFKNKDALTKAKINAIDGSLFGGPGFVRMNLALPPTKLQEVVTRLNSL